MPPDRAVWVPARLAMPSTCWPTSRCARFISTGWLSGRRAAQSLKAEFVVRVRRCCTRRSWRCSTAGDDRERRELLFRLIVHELDRAEDPTTFIPLPREARCRRAAERVLADPSRAHEIDALALEVGTSARTLSRLFSAETQLSFKTWCQRARIAAAIERLSVDPDAPMKQMAADLGYASLSAFSHAFRQVTGKTPTEFVGRG